MKTRRFGVAAVGLIALAALATGCSKAADKPGATASASTSAAASAPAQGAAAASDALTAAADKLKGTTAKMTMSMGGAAGAAMKITGQLDGPGKKSATSMDVMTLKMEVIQLGDQVYMKAAGVPGMPAGWMHIDVAKLGAQSTLRKSIEDPSYTAKMLTTAAQVQWDGTGKVKGVLDLTQSPSMNPAMVGTLGDQIKAVPFTATIDDQGRLSTMTVALGAVAPAAGVGDMTIAYSDFGAPVTIEKPAGEIVEAPAALLATL
ncbi:hypothetical protein Cme02nite_58510 [Catellatospora methionotrophica]|uniref:Lipoprotein n=1 Tax=Catellatospora methionotrophica TaxID=121620 RepID=A0A8J3LF15_9ACTN|nr:hypothetical protein [Catellatospora methionotrophica]GIG17519.1 hypothetical protein Cme02nite_58510 [Catellatospora methionotrophica]